MLYEDVFKIPLNPKRIWSPGRYVSHTAHGNNEEPGGKRGSLKRRNEQGRKISFGIEQSESGTLRGNCGEQTWFNIEQIGKIISAD